MKTPITKHPAVNFLQALYPPDSLGHLNFRFISKQGRVSTDFIAPSDVKDRLPNLLKQHKGENAFVQIGLCDGRGGKGNILEIPALWVDLDFKPGFGFEEACQLRGIPLKASIIVNSGGGLHVYWALKESATKEEFPLVENVLKRLAQVYHGDHASAEAARILRIPGTLNHKYSPPCEVKLIRLEPDRRYNLGELDDTLPPLETSPGSPKDEGDRNPPGWERPIIEEGVKEGERNVSIAKLVGRYAVKALGREEILPILLDANSRFDPPLEEAEIETILDSMMKTHQRNHPDGGEGQKTGRGKSNLCLTTLADVFNYPEPTYLIDPLLIEGTVTILGAYTGAGKSITALSIIQAVLTGSSLWGKFSANRSGPVLLIDEETPDSFLKDRVGKMGFEKEWPLHFLHFQSVRLDDGALFEAVMEKIQEVQPVLVVVDSLIRIHRQREDDATAMALVVDRLRKIANAGTTVLVIHHHRKAEGPLSQKLRGSSDIPGGVDIEYALVPKGEYLVLSSVKTRTKPFGPIRLKMEITDEAIEMKYLGTEAEEIIEEVLDVLGDDKMDIKEIHEELKEREFTIGDSQTIGINKLREFLKKAVQRGELGGEQTGRGRKWFFFTLHDPICTREAVKNTPEEESNFTGTPQKTEGGREVYCFDSQRIEDSSRVPKNMGREESKNGEKGSSILHGQNPKIEGAREVSGVDETPNEDLREIEI